MPCNALWLHVRGQNLPHFHSVPAYGTGDRANAWQTSTVKQSQDFGGVLPHTFGGHTIRRAVRNPLHLVHQLQKANQRPSDTVNSATILRHDVEDHAGGRSRPECLKFKAKKM